MYHDRIQVLPSRDDNDHNTEKANQEIETYLSPESSMGDGPTAVKPANKGKRRLVTGAIVAVILTGSVLGLLFYFGYIGGDKGFPFFEENDGFNGEDAFRWPAATQQNGLRMRILNALDPSWDAYFTRSVEEWENGTPDSLTLTTARVAADPDCSAIDNQIKVCNGQYGEDTGWYGINALLIRNDGFIANSVALMNDSLLDRASFERRQYTMCHELGHGFGLPHTDERFFNRNLGDCMDYTQFPKSNMQPGQSNFDALQILYGPPPPPEEGASDGNTVEEQQQQTPPGQPRPPQPNPKDEKEKDKEKDKEKEKEKDKDRRTLLLRGFRRTAETTTTMATEPDSTSTTVTPDTVMQEYSAILKAIRDGEQQDCIVGSTEGTRRYATTLPEGYTMEAHMLLAI